MLEDELLAPGVISSIYVTRRRRRRRAAPGRSACRTSTASTTRTSSRYAKAAKTREGFQRYLDEWSLRQGRASRLRHRPADAATRACARSARLRRSRRPACFLIKSNRARVARLAAAQAERQSVHRRLARAVRPRRAGPHRRLLPRRGADRRRGAASTWCAPRARRFPGSFGSAFMYSDGAAHHPVPRGALAARAGAESRVRLGARRPGSRCSPARRCSPGRRTGAVSGWKACIRGTRRQTSSAHTGFDFDCLPKLHATPPPPRRPEPCCGARSRRTMAADYPDFAKRVWGIN